jgi:hypothetical protein
LLRPPGLLGELFERFVAEVFLSDVVDPNDDESGSDGPKLELIKTSHVPPYGYGKTHGFTKILRFTVMPLSLAALDLVLAEIEKSHISKDTVSFSDVQQALKQLIRWHCRLSHVAAHTALMTTTLDDLITDPWEMEAKVRAFLDLPPRHEGHQLDEDLMIDEDELINSIEELVQFATVLFAALSQKEKLIKKPEELFDDTLQGELDNTNNLSDWPCLSFWAVGDEKGPTELRPIARGTAKELSPDCSAEYAKCTVPRDKCEERGDALCKSRR